MSDEPILRVRSRSSSGSGRALQLPILILSAGLWLLALAEIFQGWEMVRLAGAYETPARVGDLVSATLANGQVFFGTLDGASRTTIHLRDVFFAQLPAQAAHGQDQEAEARTPNIIRRKDNEWTEADEMAIPVDRISYMETVGPDSRIARFIAEARSQPPVIPSTQPAGRPPGQPAGQSPGDTRQPAAPSTPPKG